MTIRVTNLTDHLNARQSDAAAQNIIDALLTSDLLENYLLGKIDHQELIDDIEALKRSEVNAFTDRYDPAYKGGA